MAKKGKKKKKVKTMTGSQSQFYIMSVCVRVCICVFACVSLNSFFKGRFKFLNSAGHVPAREITISGGKKKMKREKKKPCYNVGENCQQVLLIGAYFIQCWCVVVLVHICLFNHPFFPLGGGVSRQGVGLTHEREEVKE